MRWLDLRVLVFRRRLLALVAQGIDHRSPKKPGEVAHVYPRPHVSAGRESIAFTRWYLYQADAGVRYCLIVVLTDATNSKGDQSRTVWVSLEATKLAIETRRVYKRVSAQ